MAKEINISIARKITVMLRDEDFNSSYSPRIYVPMVTLAKGCKVKSEDGRVVGEAEGTFPNAAAMAIRITDVEYFKALTTDVSRDSVFFNIEL